MPGAIVRQMLGDFTRTSKKKGKAFVREYNAAFSQEKIAKEMPKKQPCKK